MTPQTVVNMNMQYLGGSSGYTATVGRVWNGYTSSVSRGARLTRRLVILNSDNE